MARPEAAALKRVPLLVCLALSAAVLLAAACGGGEPPQPTIQPMSLPPGGPVAWPYIFSGNVTAAGRPAPAGVPIFARLGSGRSPVAETLNGRYLNIVVGPVSEQDLQQSITFHLGNPDGPSIESAQSVIFEAPPGPESRVVDLSFPRLP